MTLHRLEPSPTTTTDVFSRDLAPVLTVDPGDTVHVRSLDAAGYTERLTAPDQDAPTMISQRRGHCLTGPIAVRVTQVANESWGVHALLPWDAIA